MKRNNLKGVIFFRSETKYHFGVAGHENKKSSRLPFWDFISFFFIVVVAVNAQESLGFVLSPPADQMFHMWDRK